MDDASSRRRSGALGRHAAVGASQAEEEPGQGSCLDFCPVGRSFVVMTFSVPWPSGLDRGSACHRVCLASKVQLGRGQVPWPPGLDQAPIIHGATFGYLPERGMAKGEFFREFAFLRDLRGTSSY